MTPPESTSPTDRSGPFVNPPAQLHKALETTVSGDNDTATNPSQGSPGFPALSLPSGQCVTHITADATAPQPAPLPSLQIRTDLSNSSQLSPSLDPFVHHSVSSGSLPRRTPSLRAVLAGPTSSGSSLSPASGWPSPQLLAMGEITPLPSPIGGASPWKGHRRNSQSLSRTPSTASRTGSSLSLRLSEPSQTLGPVESRSRGKQYTSLEKSPDTPSKGAQDTAPRHARNRSLSEYVPPGRSVPVKPRPIVVSGAGAPPGMTFSSSTDSKANNLHREQYLAVHRGIASPGVRPPSPPRSSHSGYEDSDAEPVLTHPTTITGLDEIYSVRSIRNQQPRRYRKIRQLGRGAFSQVCLGVRTELEGEKPTAAHSETVKLVAVKIIDLGPAGGADEERVEVSLKREVDILKSVNHPSLVQLKAFGSDQKRALLVLDYCPGGDLFDLASSRPMSPPLIRRIFAELMAAVRYLHQNFVVHRDIKLENVLVNLPFEELESIPDLRTYDRAIVTLSDLGLSRRIPEPPESPLLQTRCGSEAYAAPEILMGQSYDGRATDGWALGVLLYAMMENRLPFDALPGTRGDPEKLRARTPHRIARVEWAWYMYADSDGEWDPTKGKGLEGARECVEGLLKRNNKRKSLDELAALDWVRGAIDVPGGLKRGDKEVP